MKLSTAIIYALTAITLTGCSVGRALVIKSARPFLDDSMTALLRESDPEIARAAMATELKLLEGLLLSTPNDYKLLTMAAQGFTGYAMLYYDPMEQEKAQSLYYRGLMYGNRALSLRNAVFGQTESRFEEFESAMESLRNEDIGAVYWTAVAWGGWINTSRTNPMAIAEFPRVRLLMDWVIDRDETYFYSGANWFYGVYYSTLPPIVGGDVEKSRTYFEKAIVQTKGEFLWGKLYYAQTYALQTINRPLFERLLKDIIEAKSDGLSEATLLNQIAKQRAKELLTQTDELFF